MTGDELDPEEAPRHWVLDMPDGLTVEALADSLTAEAEAVTAMAAGSVYIRRGGGDEPWTEVTAEMRRRC
jgi:hypothetical protein